MRLRALALVAAVTVGPAWAQDGGIAPQLAIPQSPVVVLDRDDLFAGSLFGRRVARDIDAAGADLEAENRRIEATLEAEERALTERRAEVSAMEFRGLADEFDFRVTGIRAAQEAKFRAIAQQSERAQQIFFERANPILVDLARETGALVILDRRIVIASADQIDITLLAQTRIDTLLGEGDGLIPQPTPPQRRRLSVFPPVDAGADPGRPDTASEPPSGPSD